MKIIPKNKIVYAFEVAMYEVERAAPGEIIKFETNDCFGHQIDSEAKLCSEMDFSRINPTTGPVYIEGTERGDILKVKILDIALPDKGIIVTVPGEGVLGDTVKKATTRIIKIEDGFCTFKNVRMPVRPMVGVIGVAPLKGKYPTGTPWKHGGNMDTTDIAPGSTLYFPVNQKGAFLAMGDCHAVMGDGEVCVSGCEINSEVTVKVDVIKNRKIEWPLVETKDYTMVITSGNSPADALKEATRQAVDLLRKGLRLSWDDAYMLASLVMDLKISQIVDPAKTVRAAIPKYILSTQGIIEACKEVR